MQRPSAMFWVGQLLTRFGEFEAGYRFGRLGLNLVDKRGLDRFKARVYLVFGHSISPWNDQLRTSVECSGVLSVPASRPAISLLRPTPATL